MELKIVSLNLWNGGRLLNQALTFLKEQQADLMFFQEAYDGKDPSFDDRFQTVQKLAHAFPDYFFAFAPQYVDTREREGMIEEGQVIFSRWPLSEPQNIFFDIPYGPYDQDHHSDFSYFPANVQIVKVKLDGGPCKLLNVHGPVFNDGLADTDRRLRMRDVLLEHIADDELVVLGGDFNVQPATQTLRSLAAVLQPVFPEGELESTFNMQQKTHPGFATAAVDHIFVSHDFTISEQSCPTVNISDHLPLVAKLSL